MRIDLAGWTSSGLRCPDVVVDLRKPDGSVPKVALLQMPNGTGKTTTLQLLNAALSGSADRWTQEKVRSYRRKDDPAAKGVFKVTLLLDGKPLSIELILDYETGQVSYKTTNPGSGGVVPKWHVPPGVHRFLAEEFLSLFIFDGELANRLLNSGHAEADRAVDALCQIYLLDQVGEFTRDYWDRATKQQTAKTSSGLNKWQDQLAQLRTREQKVKEARSAAKSKLKALEAEMLDLDEKIKARVSSVATVRERFEAARLEHVEAQAEVRTANAALMGAMRLPHALHPQLADNLNQLRLNLDRLKLPENTSAQFFEELTREPECICGRDMDAVSIQTIKERSKRYLDSAEAGVINNLKQDIEKFTGTSPDDDDSGFARVERLALELKQAARKEADAAGQERALKQQLIEGGDEQLGTWEARLDECGRQHGTYEEVVAEIEGAGDPDTPNDKLMSLSQIEKRLEEAKARIAEITETVRLKEQTELIQSIVAKAARRARKRIKDELLAECNARLEKILVNDPLRIDRIDGAIRLENQDGASVGQTLSVGYTFLMSVLNRGNNDFPLIVDSPAGPMDHTVRRQVGRLIPELCSQFVGFTINTERAGFVDTLETQSGDVAFLTLFRKTPGTQRLMKALPAGRYVETDNAILVNDKDYFNRFDVAEEEDENVPAAQ
ncbi:hypothetical protein [Phenylobacterium sp.]|uniref:hypothetical protein n=1 Tax=Phenylobacterium sp. TaxID=1871053 RepID=UPI002FE1E6D3